MAVHMWRQDELARVGQLHGMFCLRDDVFTPPAVVARRVEALPIVVGDALDEDEPTRAMAQHVVAQATGCQTPVFARVAETPRCTVRLIEQISGNDVGRGAVPIRQRLPGVSDQGFILRRAVAPDVCVAPQPFIDIPLERVHVEHHEYSRLLQPSDEIVEDVEGVPSRKLAAQARGLSILPDDFN